MVVALLLVVTQKSSLDVDGDAAVSRRFTSLVSPSAVADVFRLRDGATSGVAVGRCLSIEQKY